MSIRAMSNVFERQDIKSSTERFVLIALVDHASNDGENIYPAVATVCRKTGFSERTVQGAIKNLLAAGVLVRDGHGKRMTNKYRYIFADTAGDAPPQMATDTPAVDAPPPPQETAQTPAGNAPESLRTINTKPLKESPKAHKVKTYNHPALLAYREIVRRYVPRVYEQDVVLAVGEDVDRWRAHVKKWVGKGWNPQNIDGMLDTFKNGGIDKQKVDSKEERIKRVA